jgi:ABC-2 type transport system permease protein
MGARHRNGCANGRTTAALRPDPSHLCIDLRAIECVAETGSSPLLALAAGDTDLHPLSFRTPLYGGMDAATDLEPVDSPLRMLVGRFDTAFVVLYLLPLVILIINFDLLSRERDDGVLALLLSHAVSVRTLIAAKVTVRLAVMSVLILGCLLACFAGARLTSLDAACRSMWWAVVAVLYGLFWFALALWVNSRGWTSARNALALLSTWLLIAFIIPAGAGFFASTLYPAPQRSSFINVRRDERPLPPAADAKLRAVFLNNHPEYKQAGGYPYWGERHLTSAARAEEASRLNSERLGTIARNRQRQYACHSQFHPLSVTMLAQAILYDVSGVGEERQQRFRDQADGFRQSMQAFFWPRIFPEQVFSSTDYNLIPRFVFQEEDIRSISERNVPRLALLAAWPAVLCFLSMWSYRKLATLG